MQRILLIGAQGRMGQAITAAASAMNATIAHALDVNDSLESIAPDSFDAIIDFSHHEMTESSAAFAAKHGKPLVIGTTGHDAEQKKAVLAHKATIPIVWSGNYSVGVNLLNYLAAKASALLDKSYHPEIIEMHHCHKKDAPSGTAERLLDIVREARGLTEAQTKHGRQGITGERPDEEIGMHTLRGGDVVGDHTVLFAGPGERIELTHKASSREIFANGSLRAAAWAADKQPGLYTMQDVLDLNA